MNKKGLVITVTSALLLSAVGFITGGCSSSPKTVDVFWDSSLLQNVTRLTDDGLAKDWARVSPDGKQMLYCESTKSIQRSDYSGDSYQYWNIVLLRDVRIPAKTPLISDYAYAPAWSDNNTNFLYVANEEGNSRIMRSAVAGGGKTYVTRNPAGRYDARPSYRRGAILCDTNVSGKRQIVSMRDNGTEITILGEGHSPSWHPTASKFIFIRNGDLFEMDLASIQVTQIYSDPKFNCAMPSYSANGQYIVFQKGAEQKTVGTVTEKVGGFFKKVKNVVATETRWQIFTIKADGTNLSPLTMGSVDAYCPSWDVNNMVYFISNASGKTEIYRAQVNFN